MKNCVHCGTALPDEAGFCAVCGNPQSAPQPVEAPVAQPVVEAPVAPQPVYTPPVYAAPVVPVQPMMAPPVEKKESVSVGGWIGRGLIPCIPIAGGIIYFIMLWVWAGNSKYEDSFRNWAKSQLILMAIGAGVILLLVIILAAAGIGLAEVLEEAMYF